MSDYGFIAQGADPFAKLGQMAQTMNAVNQNRLFQGQQAAGAALQAATGPDGSIDYNQARALAAQDPRVAPYALDAMNKLLTNQGQSISNTTGQTNLQGLYAKNLRTVVGAVPPGPQQQLQILSAITKGVQMGLYPPDVAASFAGGGQLADGTTLADLAKQSAVAEDNPAAIEAQVGNVETVNTGNANRALDVNRFTGQRTAMGGDAGAVPMALSPGESAQRVPTVGPNGAPESVPQSALVTPTGQPKVSSLTGPHGELQAGLSPAAASAQTASGQGYGQMDVGITQRAQKVNDNKALLGNFEGLMQTPGVALGPQSGGWNKLKQLAAQYGLAVPDSGWATAAAAKEGMGKLSGLIAQNQFQGMGGTGTDAKLESAMKTSPSEFLTKQGNHEIIALLKGNEDAYQHYAETWEKWKAAGHGAETLGQFQSKWNQIYDPRVFQSQYLSPAARQTMLKGMTAEEQKQFKSDYKQATKWGWVR